MTHLDHDGNVAPWLAPAGGPRHRRAVRRRPRRSLARPRPPRAAADATAPASSPSRPPPTRSGTAPDVRRRRRARARRRARSPGSMPSTTARTARSTSLRGTRRPHLLAVQVLRPAHGAGVRARGAPAQLAPVQGAARGRRAGRAPLRARHVASTSCWRASSPRSTTSTRSAGTRSSATSARSASASSTASPTPSSSTGCRP